MRSAGAMVIEPEQLDALIEAFESIPRPLTVDEDAILLAARLRRRRNNRPPTIDEINRDIASRIAMPDPAEGERRVRPHR